MELALISKFTWIDGFALVIALLGTILYAVEFYVLATKHNPFSKDRVILFTSLAFLLYFSGNFLGLFARALAQDFFQKTYILGWVINLVGLSFMPALLIQSYAEYYFYQKENEDKLHFRFIILHIGSIYFLYQFLHDISSEVSLPWPVLTSNIKPFQFQLFAWWLGLCTAGAGFFCYLLKDNPNWKRFNSYFPINGIFLIIASLIIIPGLSYHPWSEQSAPIFRLLFMLLAFSPGALLAYYLVRYQFLNILVKPTIQYSVLMALIIIIYQFGIRNFSHYLARFDVINVQLVESILMVLLVFLFHPLRIVLHRKMNQFFFQDTEKFKQTIQDISQSLKHISYIGEMEKLLYIHLSKTLHLKKLILFVPQGKDNKICELAEKLHNSFIDIDIAPETIKNYLSEKNLNVLIKITYQNRFLGCLGLKYQSFRNSFSITEINLLTTITNQLALSLHNINLVEEQISMQKAMVKQEKLSALGQISASISHEVKNPLHSIYSLVQVLEEEQPKGTGLQKDIKTIKSEIEHLNNILDEILLYAKPEFNVNIVKTDVHKIIHSVIFLLNKEANKAGINIIFKPSNSKPIECIPGHLKEILFNLILNAIQACKSKGNKINITTKNLKNNLQIKIKDNGPGLMDPDSIFKPFFTTRKDGTGLGLSIVQNKVDELGGNIEAKNNSNDGAEFLIQLPIVY